MVSGSQENKEMHRETGSSTVISLRGSEPLIRKLTSAGFIADRDNRVLQHAETRSIARNTDIYSEGDAIGDILFLREGWAYRYRLLGDGRRQVVNFLVPGDLVGPFTPTAKQFAATLTGSSVCRVSRRDLADATRECPAFSAAVEALIAAEFDLLAERTVSLGRRNAKERLAHFLLELLDRLDRVGLVTDNSFEFPLTQEMTGDALGLSVVHVNRTLRALREAGCATVGFGRATIHDRETLSLMADSGEVTPLPHEQITGAVAMH
jgi:CRP-like cAMP-binding protein